jgi:molybdopterin converting factor small subunit
MGEITVLYYSTAATLTGCSSETFAIPDDGLKLSDLANLIASRHPNPGIVRVLELTRWILGSEVIYHLDSVILRDEGARRAGCTPWQAS